MKFQIYVRDSDPIYGGWFAMDTIDAKDSAEALELAKAVYGESTKVKEVSS